MERGRDAWERGEKGREWEEGREGKEKSKNTPSIAAYAPGIAAMLTAKPRNRTVRNRHYMVKACAYISVIGTDGFG